MNPLYGMNQHQQPLQQLQQPSQQQPNMVVHPQLQQQPQHPSLMYPYQSMMFPTGLYQQPWSLPHMIPQKHPLGVPGAQQHPSSSAAMMLPHHPPFMVMESSTVNSEILKIKQDVAKLKENFNMQMTMAIQNAQNTLSGSQIPASNLSAMLDIPPFFDSQLKQSPPQATVHLPQQQQAIPAKQRQQSYLPAKLSHSSLSSSDLSSMNRIKSNSDQQRTLRQAVKHRESSSKYRGVYFNRLTSSWRARIWLGGSSENIGSFATEEEAARAFDKRAIELRGPRAIVNFPHFPAESSAASPTGQVIEHSGKNLSSTKKRASSASDAESSGSSDHAEDEAYEPRQPSKRLKSTQVKEDSDVVEKNLGAPSDGEALNAPAPVTAPPSIP